MDGQSLLKSRVSATKKMTMMMKKESEKSKKLGKIKSKEGEEGCLKRETVQRFKQVRSYKQKFH